MNKLYYGDNLTVLRGCVADESVDLIYLDPPFNSQANYNVLFRSTAGEKSRAQIEAFDDAWHWGDEAELAFDGVMTGGNGNVAEMLRAMRAFLKENDMMAYLSMMAVRLLELRRVLKPTGQHLPALRSHGQPLSENLNGRCVRPGEIPERDRLAAHYIEGLNDAASACEPRYHPVVPARLSTRFVCLKREPAQLLLAPLR